MRLLVSNTLLISFLVHGVLGQLRGTLTRGKQYVNPTSLARAGATTLKSRTAHSESHRMLESVSEDEADEGFEVLPLDEAAPVAPQETGKKKDKKGEYKKNHDGRTWAEDHPEKAKKNAEKKKEQSATSSPAEKAGEVAANDNEEESDPKPVDSEVSSNENADGDGGNEDPEPVEDEGDNGEVEIDTTASPTVKSTLSPTIATTSSPTVSPTNATNAPTIATEIPTSSQTTKATNAPTIATEIPSFSPTTKATNAPTIATEIPSVSPTTKATNAPTVATEIPTVSPTAKKITSSPTGTTDDGFSADDNDTLNGSSSNVTEAGAPTGSQSQTSVDKDRSDAESDPSLEQIYKNLTPEQVEYLKHVVFVDEEKEAAKISVLYFIITLILMVFTAQQMSENPDGVYANVCRLGITIVGCIFKIILLPFQKYCGLCSRQGYSHHLVTTSDPYARTNRMEII